MFPLFFNVIGCEFVFPIVTVPKATLDGVAEICACNPVPLSTSVAGEPGSLLVIEMVPEALPLAVGVDVTVNVVFAPALIDSHGSAGTTQHQPVSSGVRQRERG